MKPNEIPAKVETIVPISKLYVDAVLHISSFLTVPEMSNLLTTSKALQKVSYETTHSNDTPENAQIPLALKRSLDLQAISLDGLALQFEPDELKNDKKTVLVAVKQNGLALQFVSDVLKNDKEIMLAAVKQNGLALQFASDVLKNDKEIMLAAVKQNWSALQFASDVLKNSKAIMLAAVKQNGLALLFVSEELPNYEEIALAAVKQSGSALQFVSEELSNYEEIVLAAVKQNGLALQFVSEELSNYEEIVLAAVKQNGLALQFVPPALRAWCSSQLIIDKVKNTCEHHKEHSSHARALSGVLKLDSNNLEKLQAIKITMLTTLTTEPPPLKGCFCFFNLISRKNLANNDGISSAFKNDLLGLDLSEDVNQAFLRKIVKGNCIPHDEQPKSATAMQILNCQILLEASADCSKELIKAVDAGHNSNDNALKEPTRALTRALSIELDKDGYMWGGINIDNDVIRKFSLLIDNEPDANGEYYCYRKYPDEEDREDDILILYQDHSNPGRYWGERITANVGEELSTPWHWKNVEQAEVQARHLLMDVPVKEHQMNRSV